MSSASSPAQPAAAADRSAFYAQLESAIAHQLTSSPHADPIALCANVAAAVYHAFGASFGAQGAAVNWAGFYLLRNIVPEAENIEHVDGGDSSAASAQPPSSALVLGPFHGQAAVSLIRVGRGVCGSAAASRQVQLVPNVHSRPDHIACDSASRSELVIPLFSPPVAGSSADEPRRLVGVLDMDSPQLNFFGEQDAVALGRVAEALGRRADWSVLEQPIRVRFPAQAGCSLSSRKKNAGAH